MSGSGTTRSAVVRRERHLYSSSATTRYLAVPLAAVGLGVVGVLALRNALGDGPVLAAAAHGSPAGDLALALGGVGLALLALGVRLAGAALLLAGSVAAGLALAASVLDALPYAPPGLALAAAAGLAVPVLTATALTLLLPLTRRRGTRVTPTRRTDSPS